MKRFIKISSLAFGTALLLSQLIPRPEKNISIDKSNSNIAKALNLPDSVNKIFMKSCYDCHSNHSNYPWYASIQPLSIWLNHHIEEGKEELNFSEFTGYEKNKQIKKLEEINEVVNEGEMPLKSYTLIHRNASLNELEKKAVIMWAQSALKTIRADGNKDLRKDNDD